MRASRWSRLVYTALFTALTTVATLVIQVPSPMSGYVNLGDAMVLLSAWILGPVYGTAAAGIGSMLADLLSGYAYYAPVSPVRTLKPPSNWMSADWMTAIFSM